MAPEIELKARVRAPEVTLPSDRGDLEQVVADLEAFYNRLSILDVKLSGLYGEGLSSAEQVSPSGTIPRIHQLLQMTGEVIDHLESTAGRL